MYSCWKNIPKSERQEAFDFYISLPRTETNMRQTSMMIKEWKRNHRDACCPWGVLLSMRYGMDATIVIPSNVEFHTRIPSKDVGRFMRKHDSTYRLSDAELARMMGVDYIIDRWPSLSVTRSQ